MIKTFKKVVAHVPIRVVRILNGCLFGLHLVRDWRSYRFFPIFSIIRMIIYFKMKTHLMSLCGMVAYKVETYNCQPNETFK